jgi:hypothetical protein
MKPVAGVHPSMILHRHDIEPWRQGVFVESTDAGTHHRIKTGEYKPANLSILKEAGISKQLNINELS